jgi:hypothetical protein
MYTASHPTWNARATSFQDMRFAQVAKKLLNALHKSDFPSDQGTFSTRMRLQVLQSTRRMVYRRITATANIGINRNRR